ncbi:MAG: hypothetical protein FWC56_02240 [Phycisphaerae bacterium]|nr:hypothetical protein [Phycisphaerae bacterium]
MAPKVIKTEQEHKAALARIDELMDVANLESQERDELDMLAMLVEQYENEHFPIDLPDPISAIRFRMEQQGLSQEYLVPYLGSPAEVSEILDGKRPLNADMIRALHRELGIPEEILNQKKEPALSTEKDDSNRPTEPRVPCQHRDRVPPQRPFIKGRASKRLYK